MRRNLTLAYLAFAIVCFFWGTVYLGIRIAIEAIPPLPLMGIRFFAPGLVIVLAGAAFKLKMPTPKEFLWTSLCGLLTLGLGVGTLFFSAQWIPSGLMAMFATTTPFWMVGVERLFPGGEPLNGKAVGGMLLGLVGTLVLAIPPDGSTEGFQGPVFSSFLVLQLGCAAWAVGAILQRKLKTAAGPFVIGGVQELATGTAFLLYWLSTPHQPIHWTAKGLWALAYLILIGGALTYTAYIYAVKNLPVSLVSIHNYVNPMVAVALGALLYHEPFQTYYLGAMALVCAGLFIVQRYSTSGPAGH